MMESGAHHPCAACGDDAHAACRACSYALCKACLDEDVAEGRTACARCGGEYAAFDTVRSPVSNIKFCHEIWERKMYARDLETKQCYKV